MNYTASQIQEAIAASKAQGFSDADIAAGLERYGVTQSQFRVDPAPAPPSPAPLSVMVNTDPVDTNYPIDPVDTSYPIQETPPVPKSKPIDFEDRPEDRPKPQYGYAPAITGTHQELRENQEGSYYVEVPNTQAYLDEQNQKLAAATSLANQRQADASLQNKSTTFAKTFGGTPIYTGGDVAARLYQGDEVEAASYSPLALAGYFAPTGTKGYSHTYDAQGNYTGIINTSPSGFINELSNSLAQLDSDLGLSKNAPLIVALAINVLAPGVATAIGQSLVSSGLVTSASAASAAALAGGATAAGAAAAGTAATAFATTVGSTILNTGIQLATGVPVEKALTNAVLSVAGASFTPGISSVVQEVVGNTTATNIITNAVVSAGKTGLTGGNIGDSFVTSLASGVANVGADKIISGLSINELPVEAVSVIKAGIVGTILTGDGTTAMTNAAINAGITAVMDGFSNGAISLTEGAVDSLNNIVTSTDAAPATVDTDAINLQTATNAGFSDFATYMQYGGDLQAYNAAQAGTTGSTSSTGSTSGTSGTSGTDTASTTSTAGTAGTTETAGTADTVSTAADTIVSEVPAGETTADFKDLIAATGATTGDAVVADTATNLPSDVVDIANNYPEEDVVTGVPTGALASVSETLQPINLSENQGSEVVAPVSENLITSSPDETVPSGALASMSDMAQFLPTVETQEGAVLPDAAIAENLLINPSTKDETEEQPIGGLNAVSTETPQEKIAPSLGIKAIDIAKPVISTIGSLIKSSLNRKPAAARPVGGLRSASIRPAVAKPPARMDVSKLIPIQKAVPIKKPTAVGPAKTLASTSKLSPVSNIAGLTSLVKKAG